MFGNDIGPESNNAQYFLAFCEKKNLIYTSLRLFPSRDEIIMAGPRRLFLFGS